MKIENVMLTFDSAEELDRAESIADATLPLEVLESLETGYMSYGRKCIPYLQIHEPIVFGILDNFVKRINNE